MAIVKLYEKVNLNKGVIGLTAILKEAGVDVETAPEDDFYLFMNTKGTQAKLLARRYYVLHIRKHTSVITVQDIKAVTDIFGQKMFKGAVAAEMAPPPKESRLFMSVDGDIR